MENASLALNLAQYLIFWLNNLVSDSLLLYRCFIVWGSRWPPVVVPGILIVATFATAYIGTFLIKVDGLIPLILAAVTNLVLVALTAGRIWWIRRDALRLFPGGGVLSHSNTAITMILESGTLYCIITILLATTSQAKPFHAAMVGIAAHLIVSGLPPVVDFSPEALNLFPQNIAPTLIVPAPDHRHVFQLPAPSFKAGDTSRKAE
ncbi:hypothetical protein B0H16DRAFT_1749084 [Mycena metata]|uniref:Uncharacterized protein n=1 Tax=Mycena metata TaxID=1033252 RepID=A0AAD7GQM4_9AGAR|nr:hypothetical protein B0H16DRAFT_1749084 [Mycena metata]